MKWSYLIAVVLLASLPGSSTAEEGGQPLTLTWQRAVLEGARIAVSRDGQRVALLQGDEEGRGEVVLLDGQGGEMWRYYLEEGLNLGSVGILPDGDRVFVDFSRLTEPMMPPSELHPFDSGVLALDQDGNVLWRVEREALGSCCAGTIGSYGHIEQVTDAAILCLQPGMETYTALTLLHPDTGEVLREMTGGEVSGSIRGAALDSSWGRLVVSFWEVTRAYDRHYHLLDWEADTPMFQGASRAVTADGRFVLTEGAPAAVVPRLRPLWPLGFESGTRGFTVLGYSGSPVVTAGQYAFAAGGYSLEFLWRAEMVDHTGIRDGQIGANADGITVLILLGPSRTLYRIRPLPGGESPGTVTSVSLPDASSLAPRTMLSPTGTRIATFEGVSGSSSDDPPSALHVSLFDSDGDLLDEGTVEFDPDISRREGFRPLSWSQDGSRLYVLCGGRLTAFDIR